MGLCGAAVSMVHSTFNTLSMLGYLQMINLAGQLNIVSMPSNFEYVAGSLGWTLLDIK